MKKSVFTLLITAPLLLATPLIADNVTDPTAALQKLEAEESKKLLPDALEGWEKKEGDSRGEQMAMGMMGGGSLTTAKYTHDNERVEIQIVANSPMLGTIGMMINNPMFAGSDGNEPYRYKRLKGIKKKNAYSTEITLLIAGQIMIKIEGHNLKDESVLEAYLDKMDMKKIQAVLLP